MLSIHGSGIGRGISIGPAYVLKTSEIEPPKYAISDQEINNEVTRLHHAIQQTRARYKQLLIGLPADAPKESAAFIDAHMLMLSDPLLVNESEKIIRKESVNAEYALQTQSDNLISVFEQMQDAYLRAKKADVEQITQRIMRNLLGVVTHTLDEFNDEDLSGKVIVSRDLSPAETMFIKQRRIAGFATNLGSQISHTAIIARSLKMPAVVGLHGSTRLINDNDLLIVDGLRGVILVNPTSRVLKEYKERLSKIRIREKNLNTLIQRSSKTIDKVRIALNANIEGTKDLREVKRVNAAGVGLYRTEYLFMNRSEAPTEQEQFRAYKRVATSLQKPVVIRTLDIGGDKQLDFDYSNKKSSNSSLGMRAIRLCLNNTELFKPQLRAILRASAFGKLSIMLPMISTLEEADQARTLINQTKRELRDQKIKFDPRIRVGVMIEVPAAAILAEYFANKFDFLSIGTNDLIQYTLAIDRVDDAVNYLYDPLHPAVLSLISNVIAAGNRTNIPVSLCGEMAGNVRYTRLLLALGLTNFSMDATYLLEVKEKILNTDRQQIQRLTRKIVRATDPTQARELLQKLNTL